MCYPPSSNAITIPKIHTSKLEKKCFVIAIPSLNALVVMGIEVGHKKKDWEEWSEGKLWPRRKINKR